MSLVVNIQDDMLLLKPWRIKQCFFARFQNLINNWNTLSSLKVKERKELGIIGKNGMLSKETCALHLIEKSIIEIIQYLKRQDSLVFHQENSKLIISKLILVNIFKRVVVITIYHANKYMKSGKKLQFLNFISLHLESKGKFELKNLDFES